MEGIYESLALLLALAALVAILARKIGMPYTVGLVLAGLGLAQFEHQPLIHLSKGLIFGAFLPPLIFEAAFCINWRELRPTLAPTLIFATVGVLLSAAVTAAGMHCWLGWTWNSAAIFGAIICATDPVSVIATFKEAGVHGRIRLLVETESLLNDGTAAVLFGVVLLFVSGGAPNAADVGSALVREIGGGAGIGAGCGMLILWIAGRTDDRLIQTTLTTIAAYGSFLLANGLHCSGVLSTLSCGLLLGNLGRAGAFSDSAAEVLTSFWEYAAFVANLLIFLLIGTQSAHVHAESAVIPAICAFIVATISRGVAIYGLSPVCRALRSPLTLKEQHVLWWGGLRGALALALVLGLPEAMPNRDAIVSVTFGAVALSIVAQGLSMPLLLRKFGMLESGRG